MGNVWSWSSHLLYCTSSDRDLDPSNRQILHGQVSPSPSVDLSIVLSFEDLISNKSTNTSHDKTHQLARCSEDSSSSSSSSFLFLSLHTFIKSSANVLRLFLREDDGAKVRLAG